MADAVDERRALAEHIRARRAAILDAWRRAIHRDPSLTSGESLPRAQLLDHIPEILSTFEHEFAKAGEEPVASIVGATQASAAAHGLQRWQQGYGLREVTRELGKLNECVVAELDAYIQTHPETSHGTTALARRVWAALCSAGIEESVGQFFELQQREAAGQVKELEGALEEIQLLDQQRAELWRQAAHDLRGNLGVVANATVGLTHTGLRENTRDNFVRILLRNVTTLHQLLDDVTSLARLQAGSEQRQVETLDLTPLFQQLCEGIRPLAQQRRLFLRADGPDGFGVEGDAVKIRRIAQNLVLNAVKFTQEGGITVRWGEAADPGDTGRWELSVTDTGPGLPSESTKPITDALSATGDAEPAADVAAPAATLANAGEGIGLSIVKRLCELLDATLAVESVLGEGTTFRILFPRHYRSEGSNPP